MGRAARSRMSARVLPYARDGFCAVRSFLSAEDFERVLADCRRLQPKMKAEKNSLARGRLGCFVDRRSETHAVLTSPAVRARVAALVGESLELSAYPIELRRYRVGAEMAWHQDDQLFEPAQCELVLCLDNDSDARTEWTDARGEVSAEWTPPNMALLVRGGAAGAAHRVTRLQRGTRTIVKMVWAAPDSAPLPAFYEHLDSLPGLRSRVRKGIERSKPPRGR